MNTVIISIYKSFENKTNIKLISDWNFSSSINTLLLPVFGKKTGDIEVSNKILPGNRFLYIQRFNLKLLMFLLRQILRRMHSIKILWIKDPDFYTLHNRIPHDFLVLSCTKQILLDPKKNFIYKKEYFSEGWVFAYYTSKTNNSFIFKNYDEFKIVSKLKSFYQKQK